MLMMCLLIGSGAVAQTAYLSGFVYDENDDPLPGASVIVGNEHGTSTNLLGAYTLKLPYGRYSISVSYIGYELKSGIVNIDSESPRQLNFILVEKEIELNDVIVTTDQSKNLATISAIDLKLRPIRSSQDMLTTIPGLFIAQHAGGGKAEQIFLRGFDIDHGTDITLSVDGMPVNMVSHAHGQGYADLHFLIPETIEKVSFNKGPYFSDQGNFNTAGYASFRTKSNLENSSIKLEGGQFGTFRTVGMLNLLPKNRRQNWFVAGEVFLSNGYFESPQNFSRLNLFTKYRSRLEDNSLLEISASTFTSTWDASGQIPVRAVESGQISRFGAIDDTEGGKTGRTNLNVHFLQNLNDVSTFSHRFFFSNYEFELVSNFTFFLNDPINGDQITQSEKRNIHGYTGTFTTDGFIGGAKTTTEAGGGFRYDNINDNRLSRTLDKQTILSDLAFGDINELNAFTYVSQSVHPSNRLSINASLRYDYFSFGYLDKLSGASKQHQTASIFSPKASINYKLNDQTNVFVKGGLGFHSNDTRVVIAQQAKNILPRALGVDVGTTFKPNNRLTVTSAFWYLHLDQEFVYVGDEAIVELSGQTERVGIDLSVRYQLFDWLFLDTDINYTNPQAIDNPEGQRYIPLAPTLTSVGGLSFKTKNGIHGSLRYRRLADRPANEDNTVNAEGYFLMDAVLNYTKPKFEVGLSVENLLNQEWNEAQFETESRLFNEPAPVSEIHFTPGSPLFLKVGVSYFF